MSGAVSLLSDALQASHGPLLVVTGAGISSASGIPTFRGPEPEAIWKQHDLEKATFDFFQRDPVGQWRWYLDRFATLEAARPNPAHQALVDLEEWQHQRRGEFLLVTQNIDTLHEEAGSSRMIKVHGTSDRLRCSRDGCALGSPEGSLARADSDLERFRDSPSLDTLPRCPECDALLRAHVLFFDEYYQEHRDYRFDEVVAGADAAALVLFVGTSFSVGVTDLVLRSAALRQAPCFSVDPAARGHQGPLGVTALSEPAEALLPQVCEALRSDPASDVDGRM